MLDPLKSGRIINLLIVVINQKKNDRQLCVKGRLNSMAAFFVSLNHNVMTIAITVLM